MSAGIFVYSRYERSDGPIHRIRVQPETLTAELPTGTANAAPAGPIDASITARARGSRRRYGITARKVLVEFTGALPDGYSGDPVSIPILTQAVFNGISLGTVGLYLGQPVSVLSTTREQVR